LLTTLFIVSAVNLLYLVLYCYYYSLLLFIHFIYPLPYHDETRH